MSRFCSTTRGSWCWELSMWSLHWSWECFECEKTYSWDCSCLINHLWRLLKLIGNCSVFSVHGKIFVICEALSWACGSNFIHKKNLPCLVIYSMLLTMTMQIREQAQSQFGYLGRNNSISTNKKTSGKRVKY